jgi:sialic acid synthase SpsE
VTFQIAGKSVGEGYPCFIIAEAGSNHDGSLSQAKRLIDAAADARVDAVKFQLFRADRLYPKSAGMSGYLKRAQPIFDIMAGLQMPYGWLPVLAAHCRARGVLFMASAFDEDSVTALDPFVEAHKVASYEMTHVPLLRFVAAQSKPVILSTGTATLDEVTEAVREFQSAGNKNLALMQCTACYPAPLGSLHVRVIPSMKSLFNLPVGLSDHSLDPIVGPMVAVAVGANLVEKHFSLDKNSAGPDHRFAIDPIELMEMVRRIRETESVLGSGVKAMHPIEKELKDFARRSIFSTRFIPCGELISHENVAVLRCGNLPSGLPPKEFPNLLGKRTRRDIPAETPIRQEDV